MEWTPILQRINEMFYLLPVGSEVEVKIAREQFKSLLRHYRLPYDKRKIVISRGGEGMTTKIVFRTKQTRTN